MAFNWDDPFLLDQQLTDEERMIRDTARAYCQDRLAPRVLDMFRHEHTDVSIFRELGELDMLGIVIPEQYGGAGLGYVSYGLVAREVERVDSGFRSMMSVQGSLVMVPINEFGTEAQKRSSCRSSPPASGSAASASPSRTTGRIPGGMISRARRVDGGFVLDGTKSWITSSPSPTSSSSGRKTMRGRSAGSSSRRDGRD
jgi:glutaryl-CoA dehydrogenase